MLLKQCGRHPQQGLLDAVGVGDHPAHKHIGGAGHRRQRRSEAAAGAALGHGHALAAPAQRRQHHRGQAVVINPVTQGAGAAADLGLERRQQGVGSGGAVGAGREPQLDLAGPGIGRHGGVGAVEQIGHLLSQVGLTHPPEAQQPAGKDALRQARLGQPGHGGGPPHGLQLAGHPREGEHREARHRAPDHAGGAAGGIGQHLGPLGQQGLLAVAGHDRAAAGAELGLDIGPDRRVLDQRGLKSGGNRFSGQVIGGGAQAAGGDQHPAAAGGGAHRGDHPLAVVAHHFLAQVGDALGRQLLGQPAGVAVGDVA